MSQDLISRRIRSVCAACDALVRGEVATLDRQVRVENSRLRFPSFQEVGAVWLRAVPMKEAEILSEINRFLEVVPHLDDELIRIIEAEVSKIFADGQEANHLQVYADSLQRSAARYGMRFNKDDHRFDLADAGYRATLANTLRQTRTNISDAIQLQLLQKGRGMNLSALMKDRITILKKSGKRHENLKATVSSDSVIAAAEGVLIEPGDLLHRHMSNGAEETFEVIDPGFHEAFHGIPASYQMRVRKLGLPEADRAVQSITYNLNGPNSRVSQNSVDNSVNTVTVNQDVFELIHAIRQELERLSLEDAQKASAVEILDAVEHQVHAGKPSKVAVTALLAALPHAGSIASIVSAIKALL
jgi:hypothetical protein